MKQILIVDDASMITSFYQVFIKKSGVKCQTWATYSLEEVENHLQGSHPDPDLIFVSDFLKPLGASVPIPVESEIIAKLKERFPLATIVEMNSTHDKITRGGDGAFNKGYFDETSLSLLNLLLKS